MEEIIFGLSQGRDHPPWMNCDCNQQVTHKYYVVNVDSTPVCIAHIEYQVLSLIVCGYFIIQAFRVHHFVVSRHITVAFQCSWN